MKRYTTVEVQLKAKSKVNSQKPLELKIPESQFQRNWWKKTQRNEDDDDDNWT